MICPLCGSTGIVLGSSEIRSDTEGGDPCHFCGYALRESADGNDAFDEIESLRSGVPAEKVIEERINRMKSSVVPGDPRNPETEMAISILEKAPRSIRELKERYRALIDEMEVATGYGSRVRLNHERKLLCWLLAVLQWQQTDLGK
jgi:hypothetical protein